MIVGVNGGYDQADEGVGAPFQPAWERIDQAVAARSDLAACWDELCGTDPFDGEIVAYGEGAGDLELAVRWPPELASRADHVAERFVAEIKGAFDNAVAACAGIVSGAVSAASAEAHLMPLQAKPEGFAALIADGALWGLRPDQVRFIETFQPYPGPSGDDQEAVRRGAMRHLAAVLALRDGHRRLAVLANVEEPADHRPDGLALVLPPPADRVLRDRITVASFTSNGSASEVRGLPPAGFDLIFDAQPWPQHPDDNLMARSALLIALARVFITALSRSVDPALLRRSSNDRFRARAAGFEGPEWGEVDTTATSLGTEIATALEQSDVGIGTHIDPDGNIAVLIRSGERVFVRPVPAALPLRPADNMGTAVEDASLEAASIWGLPDFVFRPEVVAKGTATRQIGDGTVVVGTRALAIQAKAREVKVLGTPEREVSWTRKKISEAANQAGGTIRSLRATSRLLTSGRGRPLDIDGSALEWIRVVIIDHPDPPDVVVDAERSGTVPVVPLLRRDWDFLFDQLRSVSAVVDYLFRVASEDTHHVGGEPARYYEFAQADARSTGSRGNDWSDSLEAQPVSYPLLPTAPVTSSDEAGHAVYRVILEDIAQSPGDLAEADRHWMLSRLDRFPAGNRADLGSLLLRHLDAGVEIDGTMWNFRRVVLDEGRLQLAFGACTVFTESHREAFRQWTMLRHHDVMIALQLPQPEEFSTVAVLLTPRYDGHRLWDTSCFALSGDLGLDPDDLDEMRALWRSSSDLGG